MLDPEVVLAPPEEPVVATPEADDGAELVVPPRDPAAPLELEVEVGLRIPGSVGTGNAGLETPQPGTTSPTEIKAPPRRRFRRFNSA